MKHMAQPRAPAAASQAPLFKQHQAKTNSTTRLEHRNSDTPALPGRKEPTQSLAIVPRISRGFCYVADLRWAPLSHYILEGGRHQCRALRDAEQLVFVLWNPELDHPGAKDA
jgi:hypothetical protein